MLKRLKKYIDYKGISISAFERSIGISNASFSKTLKNGKGIGSEKIEKILNVYSDLNPTWLLTGKGNMLISDYNTHIEEDSEKYITENNLQSSLNLSDEQMDLLNDYIDNRIKEILKNVKLKID